MVQFVADNHTSIVGSVNLAPVPTLVENTISSRFQPFSCCSSLKAWPITSAGTASYVCVSCLQQAHLWQHGG